MERLGGIYEPEVFPETSTEPARIPYRAASDDSAPFHDGSAQRIRASVERKEQRQREVGAEEETLP